MSFTHLIKHNGKVIDRATNIRVALRRAQDLTDPSREGIDSSTAVYHSTTLEIHDLRTGESLAVNRQEIKPVLAALQHLWDGRCHGTYKYRTPDNRAGERCRQKVTWPNLYCKRHP